MNNKNKIILVSIMLMGLSGCSGDSFQDIKGWMNEQRMAAKGKIEPLPSAKSFVAVPFVFHSDPFKDKPVLSLDSIEKNKYAPDPNRRKEPLESYSLETLKMVGSINKDGEYYAMIKTPDKTVHYVKKGNYMGNNYGQITEVTEGSIILDERVHDSDEWKPKKTIITLEDNDKN
jgi:type IV pilus assembly protein PilP